MKITLDAPTPRRLAILLMALTISASSGCLFLEPDSDDVGLQLHMVAQAPEVQMRAECLSPRQILADERPGALAASARVFLIHPDLQRVEKLIRTVPLHVGPPETDGSRVLDGVADFELGPVGSEYRLEAILEYLPAGTTDLLGNWLGEMDFEFGGVTVEDLQIRLLNRTGNSYSGDITARLNTSDPLPESFAFNDFTVDSNSGEIEFSYRVNSFVDFDESDPGLDVIVASFKGAIVSAAAFRGELPLGELDAADGGRRALSLEPSNPDCIDVGTQIRGQLTLSLHPATGENPLTAVLGPVELQTQAGVLIAKE